MIKRSFDIVISILALIILLPILFIIAISIKIKLGSPILFYQQRIGHHIKPFKIIKFRTMKDSRDSKGEKLSDDERLTTFGRALRALSIDELPELVNVIKGDMSLVGPRPLLTEYKELYTKDQLRRHELKPGITGWAQINGRNAISWTEKFKLDLWYIDNWSIALDLKILFSTIIKVVKKDGINQDDKVTMEYFNGSN
ncbi:MAG: sugar transferase [Peptostreptococcaceae bacterium]